MRSEQETERALALYADTVRRICMVHLKNEADTEDIFQTVFIKYLLSSPPFRDAEHEKAWFIRVTINACKDLLRTFFCSRTVPRKEIPLSAAVEEGDRGLWEAVWALPENYRDVLYLHYYEGYTAPQIGKLLHKNVNTVYTLLGRAKKLLRERLEGEDG